MGFGPRFSYSVWQNMSRDQSNLERIDWLVGPKIRIVGLSFVELKMDKTLHLKLYSLLSGSSKHQLQWNISIY